MQISYIYIQDFPPIHNLSIYPKVNDILENRQCAIRFLVGNNGVGKSRVLQAITYTFIELRRHRFPQMSVLLVYHRADIGGRKFTVLIRSDPENPINNFILEFPEAIRDNQPPNVWHYLAENINWKDVPEVISIENQSFKPGSVQRWDKSHLSDTLMERLLPEVVVVYSSGDLKIWDSMVSPPLVEEPKTIAPQINEEIERPLDWDEQREKVYQEQILQENNKIEQGELTANNFTSFMRSDEIMALFPHYGLWNENYFLFTSSLLDLVAWTMLLWIKAFPEKGNGLIKIWQKIGWEDSVSFALRFNQNLLNSEQANVISKMAEIATHLQSDGPPSPYTRYCFDFEGGDNENDRILAQKIISTIGSNITYPFQLFQYLYRWKQNGSLKELKSGIKKVNVPSLLRYYDFSDGEKMFFGRTALIYLFIETSGGLLLLDEPETHFNDYWKRELIDIIDDALKDSFMDILVVTHSSIVLTDAFSDEIMLLALSQDDASIELPKTEVKPIGIPTFGADPSEIMIRIFHAEESIGRRANEYLEKLLEKNWQSGDREELERIINTIGAGYYRSELRRIAQRLKTNDSSDHTTS